MEIIVRLHRIRRERVGVELTGEHAGIPIGAAKDELLLFARTCAHHVYATGNNQTPMRPTVQTDRSLKRRPGLDLLVRRLAGSDVPENGAILAQLDFLARTDRRRLACVAELRQLQRAG